MLPNKMLDLIETNIRYSDMEGIRWDKRLKVIWLEVV